MNFLFGGPSRRVKERNVRSDRGPISDTEADVRPRQVAEPDAGSGVHGVGVVVVGIVVDSVADRVGTNPGGNRARAKQRERSHPDLQGRDQQR